MIVSMLAIALGTGNIWRFPRVVANNGGEEGATAFLVAWVVCLFTWSIPLIVAEYALGRKGRMGPVGTIAQQAGPRFAWMGAFVAFVSTAIMFYYAVVTGWCVYYFVRALAAPLPADVEAARLVWSSFQASAWPVVGLALAMGLGGWLLLRGVRAIERANTVLIPVLFLMVLVALVRALTLDNAGPGIAYLFTPDWAPLAEPRVWLEALTQNAWDTGAGWGLILTYAAYMRDEEAIVKNAFVTAVGNNLVSIVAAVTVFGIVFAVLGARMAQPEILQVMRESGPGGTGLTFIWMPILYDAMPFGRGLAVLFFLGLACAAFGSLISMIELAARVLIDMGVSRAKSLGIVCLVGFACGVPSALDLGVLGNQDFVWGVALMISGGFIAFAVNRYGTERFRREHVAGRPDDWSLGYGWSVLMRYVVPLQAVALLAWWMYLSITEYAPATWYDVFSPYSVMTCLVQWGLVLLVFLLSNRWMARRTLQPAPAVPGLAARA